MSSWSISIYLIIYASGNWCKFTKIKQLISSSTSIFSLNFSSEINWSFPYTIKFPEILLLSKPGHSLDWRKQIFISNHTFPNWNWKEMKWKPFNSQVLTSRRDVSNRKDNTEFKFSLFLSDYNEKKLMFLLQHPIFTPFLQNFKIQYYISMYIYIYVKILILQKIKT